MKIFILVLIFLVTKLVHASWVAVPENCGPNLRPSVKIIREVMFREWGVAFLENINIP